MAHIYCNSHLFVWALHRFQHLRSYHNGIMCSNRCLFYSAATLESLNDGTKHDTPTSHYTDPKSTCNCSFCLCWKPNQMPQLPVIKYQVWPNQGITPQKYHQPVQCVTRMVHYPQLIPLRIKHMPEATAQRERWAYMSYINLSISFLIKFFKTYELHDLHISM